MFTDWMEKYEYIIELGKDLPLIPAEFKTKENLVSGCQSQVWLHADIKDGKLEFSADSDAIITKGLIALMVRVFSGQSPQDIATADLFFINEIGLTEHLSPTRSNGLMGMVKKVKMYALANMSKVKTT